MSAYRFLETHSCYFVTFSVIDFLPVFIAETPCKIITDSLNFCHENKYLCTNAFVIMPTHIHAILFDADHDPERIRKTVGEMRRVTGKRLIRYCEKHMPNNYSNIMQNMSGTDRQMRFWKSYVAPEAIFARKFWEQKTNYIHFNPVRKGLVQAPEYWKYSSASYWLANGHSDVILTAIEW